jgi:hypothetical protein
MNQTTHETFWQLPPTIRHHYPNPKDVITDIHIRGLGRIEITIGGNLDVWQFMRSVDRKDGRAGWYLLYLEEK